MATKKPLKYRDLRKRLRAFGIEEEKGRGKGSQRIFVGALEGHVVRYPKKCHNDGDDKPVPVVEAMRRRFRFTTEHGVSDRAFCGK